MLHKHENERVTKVGPGTPMGETMRRYWIPALLSWELPEPDCAPVKVRLLGEDLVAFRTTDGRVGVLEEFCPHRRASLWLGRNEENGLRCVYHGWKFDVDGNCVEQMNEPRPFCDKVRVVAYPAIELGGVVWTYMGPKEKMPPPPEFEWAVGPETHRAVSKVLEECNWLQALEGGIDTSHFTILHRAITASPRQRGIPIDSPGIVGGAPDLQVDITDYGYRYYGIRPLGDDELYVRGYHFIMPFTQLRPAGPDRKSVHGHFWVPIDDETCWVWNWYFNYGDEPIDEDVRVNGYGGNRYGTHVSIENGFRAVHGASDGWGIDRDMQRHDTFTGIDGVNQQDRAVQESMGPIVERSREHLGPADKAIIAMRKLLLKAVADVEAGRDPAGTGDSYYETRAAEGTYPRDADWHADLLKKMHPRTGGVPSESFEDALGGGLAEQAAALGPEDR